MPSDILICVVIKAIIFDLGGVLLRTRDFSARDHLAERLGMGRLELEELIFSGDSGDRAQRGEITAAQHWENLRHKLNCSEAQFNALLEDFYSEDELDQYLVDYVNLLHGSYKTALLSNALDDLRQAIAEKWHFEKAFDYMIISAEVKMVKPEPGIFRLALDKLRVNARQAIFVDDMRRNVEAAGRLGLNAIQFQSPQQVRLDIDRLLDEHGK